MTKTLAAQTRLLIAFIISAPTLLGVFWLFRNGSRNTAAALFFVLFFADFLVLKQKPVPLTTPSDSKMEMPSSAIWVIGAACFLGSLSALSSAIRTHEPWEIVLASCGVLASGLGVAYFARK
jgi:hypothetical protein